MNNAITTPSGTARYPWLVEPNTRFNEDGVFQCDLIVSEKDGKAFEKTIKKALKSYHDEELRKSGKSKLRLADLPCRPFDDEEDEYGDSPWFIRAKLEAQYVTKAGKTVKNRVVQFDSKNNVINEQVGSGSVLKMAVVPYFWNVASKGIGVTLKLQAVQVIELQSYNAPSQATAEGFGFTTEEQGYVSDGEDLVFTEDKEEVVVASVDMDEDDFDL